jgi:hypothetical protein
LLVCAGFRAPEKGNKNGKAASRRHAASHQGRSTSYRGTVDYSGRSGASRLSADSDLDHGVFRTAPGIQGRSCGGLVLLGSCRFISYGAGIAASHCV